MILRLFKKHKNIGLLILRVGIGGMFIFHGAPKFFGGPESWKKLGMAVSYAGIHFLPVFWGFMAAFSEFVGGICLVLGLFFPVVCMLMTMTMLVASTMHLSKGDGLKGASHAIELGIVFLSLIFIGPGKFSLDELFKLKKNR